MSRPVVAIVGRPNVGKSTLFNRLVGRRRSIVADQPGVTRDRIYADAELAGDRLDYPVVLVDTGGFDPKSADPIMQRVLDQTQLAIDEADVVVFVVDGRDGLLPEDHEIAARLRKAEKPVIVAANKLDNGRQDSLSLEFHRLGLAEVVPISASHGRHIGDLESSVVDLLPPREIEEAKEIEEEVVEAPVSDEAPIRVAVIGRPNAGKSSLVNRIIGEDRHLVSAVAGTTIDSVDSLVERDGRRYLLIDTAGVRRKRSIAARLEKYSVFAALKGLERSDVALLLLDSTGTIAEQDAKVAAFAFERGRAVILVVSKWDTQRGQISMKAYTENLRRELAHLAYAPVVFTSAENGYGIDRLFARIRTVHEENGRRVPTGELNRFVEQVMLHHPPPSKGAKRGKIFYVTQIGVRPPRFQVSVNDPGLIHFSYRRYLLNELRKAYGFSGAPVLVGYRARAKRVEPRKKRRPR